MSISELLREVRERPTLPPPEMRRAIRKAAGITQARLAGALGVHEITLLRWEHGSHEPRGEHLVAYARALEEMRGLG